MLICGIDEAGKGSVLGPMVTAGVVVSDTAELSSLGIKDSKQLTPLKREKLYAEITGSWKTCTVIRTPQEIDARNATMNQFTAACHAAVLRELAPDTVYLDACDVNAGRFGKTVLSLSGITAEVISEHKADDRHVIVGAASIVAKVTRDHCITDLNREFGQLGSGYPSDPVTIRFLTEYITNHGGAPSCARKSWQTVSDILAKIAQKNIMDYI